MYGVYHKDLCDQEQWDNLPFLFDEAKLSGQLPEECDTSHLIWVDWALIKSRFTSGSRSRRFKTLGGDISFTVPSDEDDESSTSSQVILPFSRFSKESFGDSNFRNGIQSFISKMQNQL